MTYYKDRPDKSVNAPDFLRAEYAEEIKLGKLTLSDLRKIDKSLWAGLRNWANAGKHNLDDVIPRGQTKPGRPGIQLNFDPATLNPDNSIDALALQALKNREAARKRAAEFRRRQKLNLSPK